MYQHKYVALSAKRRAQNSQLSKTNRTSATMTYQKSLFFVSFGFLTFLIIFSQPAKANEPDPDNFAGISNEPEPPNNIPELSSEPQAADISGVYIVYMGSAAPPENRKNHKLLMSFLLRKNIAIENSYTRGLLGFSARMSDAEALKLARHPGVVSVLPDSMLQLHTTRSWDFLSDEMPPLTHSLSRFSTVSSSQGSNTIIGILDTGIWPESESFDDKGMGAVPSKWKGTCMQGVDFNASVCNRKIIGARFYGRGGMISPRDDVGHGTHVASTAAGVDVLNASYYGLALGTAKAGSPAAHIAMYKTCIGFSCSTSSILAAFDDAIGDGVDILSLSLGFPPEDFWYDPIAIGAFHAVQSGITVVCSAGNSGPQDRSVTNVAPWILTVGATTIDRDLESSIVLGNNKVVQGGSLTFSTLNKRPTIPLLYGGTLGNGSKDEPRYCYQPGKAEAQKINGSIVVCKLFGTDDTTLSLDGLISAGAAGLIILNDPMRLDPIRSITFPLTFVTSKDGSEIIRYISSTRNPVATILATETVTNFKPAPTVAYFSSRGPTYNKTNIIKPDIAAPGVHILAAWRLSDTGPGVTPIEKKPPKFNIESGTSMSAPHVSGIAATIKSLHPTWSPAAIRSAIMTTAIQTNNVGELITTETGEAATPYDFGAGQVTRTGGLQPGLVYDMDPEDYLLFLCYYGYTLSKIRLISANLPKGFSCPKDSSIDLISNLNYPSIFISKNIAASPVTVTRTVTNVDSADKEAVYTVMVEAPKPVAVFVSPTELRFTGTTNKLSYQITFVALSPNAVKGDMFGAVIWANDKYNVRIPFVVSNN